MTSAENTLATVIEPPAYPRLDGVVEVEYAHAGSVDTFLAHLTGHDPQEHAEQVLAAWLAWTAEKFDLPIGHVGDDGDESDEAWEVTDVRIFSSRVCVIGTPYRGDDVAFLFTPPEA